MQKLTVIYCNTFNTYKLAEEIKQSIGFLKLYLDDVPLWAIPSEIEWALNTNDINRATNDMSLEKKDNYILMSSSWTNPKAKIQYFKILIPEFVKILTEWEKLAKAKTQKIIIAQADNGIMTIEGE